MTARLHFELPQTLVINANQREHHMAKAARVRNLREMAALVAKRERVRVGSTCAALLIEIEWPDKRRRDVENLAPTIKALTDGCIDAGLLPDDDDKHIVERTWRARPGSKPGITVIDMTFFPRIPGEVIHRVEALDCRVCGLTDCPESGRCATVRATPEEAATSVRGLTTSTNPDEIDKEGL